MQVIVIYPEGFAANGYLVTADGKNAVAVDPARPDFLREAEKRGLSVRFVLLTHGHFDHIGGCAALQAAGAEIGCPEGEQETALFRNLGEAFGFGRVPPFSVSFTYADGDVLSLCGLTVRVISTPGHTSFGACYLMKEGEDAALFTGDTLFAGSVGRTDLPAGDARALEKSLRKLAALEGNYPVFPGHGEPTDLETERRENPFLKNAKGGDGA